MVSTNTCYAVAVEHMVTLPDNGAMETYITAGYIELFDTLEEAHAWIDANEKPSEVTYDTDGTVAKAKYVRYRILAGTMGNGEDFEEIGCRDTLGALKVEEA